MTRDASRTRTGLRGLVLSAALVGAVSGAVNAQWVQQTDQFYLPAEHNWAFRDEYAPADRLFNAFDYGHAILYEKLYTKPDAPPAELEEKEYRFITQELLVHPPRVPLEEGAIEIAYAKLAPEAKMMFDWAHVLHRQIYDVWADEEISLAEKDVQVAELIRYYKARPDIAFSSVPKNMELMEGQYYSLAFRREYPKFNGLIWAYHWLQVGLYQPLVTGKTPAERQTGVLAAVARFKQMLESAPENMPRLMPMTAAVAPEFARRYPEAAIIFDNLHAMHDVISDVLASAEVPKEKKREEILKAAARYRDATSFAWTEQEWRTMSRMMGVENMGGVAAGFLESLPKPTVAIGATHADAMQHGGNGGAMPGMDHSKMSGMQADSGGGVMRDSMAGMEHGAMEHSPMAEGASDSSAAGMQAHGSSMMEMHRRMMADPVIRQRMLADTAMQRMMQEMEGQVPPDGRGKTGAAKGKKAPAAPRAEPADTASAMDHEGMDHGDMPGMQKEKP
ncbi:MAG: hypothetical protein ACR2HK_07000 [Gemmatimonadales bacterium]